MRKHKSVVAILLAVMMIFTFMPAMAFASVTQGNAIWADDLQSATNKDGQAVTVKTDAEGTIAGLTEATAWENNAAISSSSVYYFNLDGAEINVTGPLSNEAYKNLASDGVDVEVKVKNPAGSGTVTVNKAAFASAGWNVKYKVDSTLNNTEDVDANIDVVFTAIAPKADMNGSAKNQAYLYKTVATKTVKVRGVSTAAVNDFYMLDANGNKVAVGETINKPYDGVEHQVLIDAMKGYSLKTYKWLTSGSWSEIDPSSITYKDAADTVYYKAVYKKTDVDVAGEGTITKNLAVTVTKNENDEPWMGWTKGNAKKDANKPGGYYYDLTESQAADPTAFIEFGNDLGYAKDQAGYSADVEELKTVFGELYTVDVTTNAIDTNQQVWTIVKKTGSDDVAWAKAFDATKKAHATLFANYAYLTRNEGLDGLYDSVTVVLKADTPAANDKDDDISFEGQTKYVYSGKKTTKKGVLKAKKTITVNATADSGNEITYVATKTAAGKITVSKAGKITVKKGLKKGTYKVTVKAKTAAGNGYKAAKEKQTYTIVIKK